MEGKQKRESFRKKAGLLAHHLRPAASAFALGIGASLAATLLRTLFTQIIRFTVDHALLGETDGLPAFLLDAPAGRILVWCAAAAATVALLEFGAGFAAAKLRGSQNNDDYVISDGQIRTVTNNAGGILGGITTGMPLIFRAALKPTPSISRPQQSVDLNDGKVQELIVKGRHDPCIVPRAVPVIEAAAAIAIFDMILGNTQTDRRKP
mgnify:CR=1 FL=1